MFTLRPLIVTGIQIFLDNNSNSRVRKIEVVLMYLFGSGVAGSGIGGFFPHFFLSDTVAEAIGWSAGAKVGFAPDLDIFNNQSAAARKSYRDVNLTGRIAEYRF